MCKYLTGKQESEIVVTPEIIEAGEDVILGQVGGASDVSGFFSARDLATAAYRAMDACRFEPKG